MRTVDQQAIAAASLERFRSEYHYALWEYLRSAKVIEAVERAGARVGGRVLDSGCGGGGTALSIAEESSLAIGLDLDGRFVGSGTRLAAEKGIARAGFVQGNGQSLPFKDGVFDLVLSHSVIEHVLDARAYLAECHRVLRPSSRCSGTGTSRRGRCAPARDWNGAVERYRMPPGRSTRWHSAR